MEENERVFDMIDRLSVMVDNDRSGRLFIESREIDKAALMGIDNDEQGLSRHEREGFVDIDYLAVPAVGSKHIDSGAGKVAVFIEDDIRVDAESAGYRRHADCRAESVHIRERMTHYHHAVARADKTRKRRSRDAGLEFCDLFDALGNAAEELILVLRLDRRLVSAASERHIERLLGGLFAIGYGDTGTDTYGEGQTEYSFFIFILAYLVENAETVDAHLLEHIALGDYHEPLLGDFAHDAVILPRPVLYHLFNSAAYRRALAVSVIRLDIRDIVGLQEHYDGSVLYVSELSALHLAYIGEIENIFFPALELERGRGDYIIGIFDFDYGCAVRLRLLRIAAADKRLGELAVDDRLIHKSMEKASVEKLDYPVAVANEHRHGKIVDGTGVGRVEAVRRHVP